MGLVESLSCCPQSHSPAVTSLQPWGHGSLHPAAGIWAGNTTECPEGLHVPSSASGARRCGCGRTRRSEDRGSYALWPEHPPCWSLRWVAPLLIRPRAPPGPGPTPVSDCPPCAHSVHGPWPSWTLMPLKCCNPGDGKVGVLFCLSVSESPQDLPLYPEELEAFPLVLPAPATQATFGSLSPAGVPGGILLRCSQQRPRKPLRGELDWGCQPAGRAHVGHSRAVPCRVQAPAPRPAALWDRTGPERPLFPDLCQNRGAQGLASASSWRHHRALAVKPVGLVPVQSLVEGTRLLGHPRPGRVCGDRAVGALPRASTVCRRCPGSDGTAPSLRGPRALPLSPTPRGRASPRRTCLCLHSLWNGDHYSRPRESTPAPEHPLPWPAHRRAKCREGSPCHMARCLPCAVTRPPGLQAADPVPGRAVTVNPPPRSRKYLRPAGAESAQLGGPRWHRARVRSGAAQHLRGVAGPSAPGKDPCCHSDPAQHGDGVGETQGPVCTPASPVLYTVRRQLRVVKPKALGRHRDEVSGLGREEGVTTRCV